jgi:hypothetical protein
MKIVADVGKALVYTQIVGLEIATKLKMLSSVSNVRSFLVRKLISILILNKGGNKLIIA